MVRLTEILDAPWTVYDDPQLNGGPLNGATLSVTTETDLPQHEDDHDDERPIDQSDKPRAGSKSIYAHISTTPLTNLVVMAEYLAKGYMLQDHILQRAIEMDSENRTIPSPPAHVMTFVRDSRQARYLEAFPQVSQQPRYYYRCSDPRTRSDDFRQDPVSSHRCDSASKDHGPAKGLQQDGSRRTCHTFPAFPPPISC